MQYHLLDVIVRKGMKKKKQETTKHGMLPSAR